MRILLRYSIILLACLLVTSCATWQRAEKPKPTASTAVLPSAVDIKNIALLLPLAGPLGSAGQAVRDGFITAYNSDTSTQKPAHFIIIDTYNRNIIDAYQKAVKADADMIVGPLEKNNVQALVQANVISLPTLALNYLDNNVSAPVNLFQFGLSPLDEARQAAALAKQNGGENAVILAPQSSWGQTLAQAYQNEWQALGGNVITKLFFSSDSDTLNDQIHTLVSTYQQKFNVILLAASPQMARQIKPLLKFYYAGDVPVYATSLVYTGTPQPAYDNDLNGISFCDMPWTLTDNPTNSKLRQQIALFWSANFKQNARLYALGIDAYQLVKDLAHLAASQQTIAGTTGSLFINNQHLIVRQLTCAQFAQGVPQLLNADNNDASANDVTDASSDNYSDDGMDNSVDNSANIKNYDTEQANDENS
jgi:hypothetical protein